jgi:hypothetical protein
MLKVGDSAEGASVAPAMPGAKQGRATPTDPVISIE